MMTDYMRTIIAAVHHSEERGRGVTAALALVALREQYEQLPVEELPEDERSWEGFAAKHIQLPSHRVHELIGELVHRANLLTCTSCKASVRAPCACGTPYISDHRWATPLPPLRERIADTIRQAPELSDRAVAKKIGCDHKTVGRVRKELRASPQIPHGATA